MSFPTKVEVVADGSSRLAWTATYTGTDRVDTTVVERNPASGKYQASNGGSQSSHKLLGEYSLFKDSKGDAVFEGFSVTPQGGSRITLHLGSGEMWIREDLQNLSTKEFVFRNRFSLKR